MSRAGPANRASPAHVNSPLGTPLTVLSVLN